MSLTSRTRFSLALATSLALLGCAQAQLIGAGSAAGQISGAPSSPLVSGTVEAGGDLVGATATLYGTDGKAIATTPVNGGVYLFRVASVPDSYRVAVTGGTLNGQAFTAELRAEHRPESKVQSGPQVDWVSTLASRTLDATKGQSLQDAFKAVKRYLDVPDGAELESDREVATYFDAAAFLKAAGPNPGAAVDQAVAGVTAGQVQAYAPAGAQRVVPLLAIAAAKFVGENIASTLVGSATDAGLNFVLSALGLGGDDASAAANKKLDQLQDQVEQLKTKVDALAISSDKNASYTNYTVALNTRLASRIDQLLTLDNLHDKLARLQKANATRADLDAVKAEILDREKTYFASPTEALTGWEQGIKAVLPLFTDYVIARNPNAITPDMTADIYSQWQYLDGLQAKMLAYLIAYQTATNVSTTLMQQNVLQWQQARVNEMALVKGVPASVATDTLGASKFQVAAVTTTMASLPDDGVYDRLNKTVWRQFVPTRVAWFNVDGAAAATAKQSNWRVASARDHQNIHKGANGAYRTWASMGMDASLDAINTTFWTSDRSPDKTFDNLADGSYSVGPKSGTFAMLDDFLSSSDLVSFVRTLKPYGSVSSAAARSFFTSIIPGSNLTSGGFGGFGSNKSTIPANAGASKFATLRDLSPDEVKRRTVRLAYQLSASAIFNADILIDLCPTSPYHLPGIWKTGLCLAYVQYVSDADAAKLPVKSN